MEIERVIELKDKMEKDIYSFIHETYKKFEDETGLYPYSIDIETVYTMSMGQCRPRNELSSINIKVEI